MKNAMLNVSALSFALVAVTGCNSSSDIQSTQTVSTASAQPKTLVQTNGCSASAATGGADINCGDGSGAHIANGANGANGSNGAVGSTGAQGITGATGASGSNGGNGVAGATGATGSQGVQGATGAAGLGAVQLVDGNGHTVGDVLLQHYLNPTGTVVYMNIGAGYTAYNIGGLYSYVVWDNVNGVAVTYNNGYMGGNDIQPYFTSSNCTGTAYVLALSAPANAAIQLAGSPVYRTTSTIQTLTAASTRTPNGVCNAIAAGNQAPAQYLSIASYNPPASIPAALQLPVSIVVN